MKNQNEDVFLEYLTKKPNLSYTLDILQRGDAIRARVLKDFWQGLLENLQNSAPKGVSSESLGWELYPDAKKMNENYAGLDCWHLEAEEQALLLNYTVQQYCVPSKYQIYFGLSWENKQSSKSKVYSLTEVRTLQRFLADKKFKRTDWWLGWKYITQAESREDFLSKYAKDREEVLLPIHESFWRFFKDTTHMVMKANRAVRNFKGK